MKFSFDDFHVFLFKGIQYWAYCLFSWLCPSHKTCALTLFEVFSWLCFHESYMSFISFDCQLLSDFHVSWNIILFYSLLAGFRTSLQIFHITSCGILHTEEFSNIFYFQTYFWKPFPLNGRLVGRPCLVCSYWKSF